MAICDGVAKKTKTNQIEGMDRCIGWEKLPDGPLIEIAHRLFNFQDFQVLHFVCTHWHSVLRASMCKFLDGVYVRNISPQVPWLMMAEQEVVEINKRGDQPSQTLCLRPCSIKSKAMHLFFYIFSFQRVRDLVTSIPPQLEPVNVEGSLDNCCYFSSHGWLLVVKKRSSSTMGSTMCLYNPFVGPTHNYISLPRHDILAKRITRFSLSASPCTNSYTVMVAYESNKVAFWRPGDKGWTLVKPSFCVGLFDIVDVIIYQGYCYTLCNLRHIYRICSLEEIEDFTKQGGDDEATAKFDWTFIATLNPWTTEWRFLWRGYFLEVDDKLLVAVRVGIRPELQHIFVLQCDHLTAGFLVMEIDVGKRKSGEELVKKVESLKNKSLFVGRNQAFAIEMPSGSEASCYYGCKPNHIYFTDDRLPCYPTTALCVKGTDKGVYNMADGSVEHHFPGLSDDYSPMLWVEPRC